MCVSSLSLRATTYLVLNFKDAAACSTFGHTARNEAIAKGGKGSRTLDPVPASESCDSKDSHSSDRHLDQEVYCKCESSIAFPSGCELS